MAWAKREANNVVTTTKHSHPMCFGKHVEGCPRCAEIKAGAPVVKWAKSRDQIRSEGWKRHDCKASGCGVVCTFGEW